MRPDRRQHRSGRPRRWRVGDGGALVCAAHRPAQQSKRNASICHSGRWVTVDLSGLSGGTFVDPRPAARRCDQQIVSGQHLAHRAREMPTRRDLPAPIERHPRSGCVLLIGSGMWAHRTKGTYSLHRDERDRPTHRLGDPQPISITRSVCPSGSHGNSSASTTRAVNLQSGTQESPARPSTVVADSVQTLERISHGLAVRRLACRHSVRTL